MTDPATPTTPIKVDENSTPKAVMTAAQYIVTMITSYAIGKGWIGSDTVGTILALVPVIVPALYGVFKTIQNNREKVIMEPYVPDPVATKAKPKE